MENSSLTADTPVDSSSPVDDFSMGLLLYIINKSIIWLFLMVIISFSLSIIYLRYTPRVYQATTSILLKVRKTTQILNVKTPLENQDAADINREIQLIKSTLFIDRVVARLPLQVGYYKEGKTKLIASELYTSSPFEVEVDTILNSDIINAPIYVKMLGGKKIMLSFTMNGTDYDKSLEVGELLSNKYFSIRIRLKKAMDQNAVSGDIYNFRFLDRSAVVDEIVDKIEVQPLDPSTRMISLAYKDGNPNKARDILAAVCDEYIKYDIVLKSESFQNVLKFIDSQIDTFGLVFDQFQDSVTMQRIKDGYLNYGDSYLNNLSDKATGFESKFSDFEYDISLMKALKQLLIVSKEYSNLPSIKFKTSALSFDNDVKLINDLQQQRDLYLLDVTPEHPQVRLIDRQIDEYKVRLNKNIDNAQSAIQDQYSLLKQEYQKYLDEIIRMPGLQSKYSRLEKMAAMRNEFVNNLFSQKSNYLIAGAAVVSDYVIIDAASADPNPISPNELKIKLSGLLIGLILGVIMIAIRYLLHSTITSVDDVVK